MRDNPATKLLSEEHDDSIAEYSGFGLVKKSQEQKDPQNVDWLRTEFLQVVSAEWDMSDQKCTSYEVTIPFKDGKTRMLRLYKVDDLKLACEKISPSIEGKEV